MLAAVLWLGFLLGLRHALEADHLSAVAALASGSGRIGATLRVAGAWGFGHALVLAGAGTLMIAAGALLPQRVAQLCEVTAALALIWIGIGALRRAFQRDAADDSHSHAPPIFLSRALLMGGLHGLEGSGAAVLIAIPAVRSSTAACAYLGMFGLGSIAGMLGCSLLIALPIEAARRRSAVAVRALELIAGVISLVVGATTYMRSIFT